MTRRSFITRGLFGGLLLAGAGGLGLGLWPSRIGWRSRGPLKVLNERQFAVLAAVAARTVRAPAADPQAIAERVDATLAFTTEEAQNDFRQLLLLFENALAGLVLDGRPRPFTRLRPEEQDAVLDAWRGSHLVLRRSGYQALRKLTLAAHYSSAETWASVGYAGPPQISGVPT
jgi:hypothetical protein